ncbi:oxidoreductase [Ktedonobacteria bacterium brp13]|nr:oxidoreductase [Ktedonobacteria bacterium brp13]
MRALRFHQFGEPASVLHTETVPDPIARSKGVVVKILAASVNASDVRNIQGTLPWTTTLPRTPGRDFAGIVVQGPTEYLSKEVWGTGDLGLIQDGSHTDYLVIPEAAVAEKPNTLSFEDAATVGVAYITAWLSLLDAGHLVSGDVLAVTGANGAVGTAAIQLAKWRGATVIGIIRRESTRQAVLRAGADYVLNMSQQDMHDAILAITGGKGSTMAFDTVGGELFEPCLNLLSRKGRLIAITMSGPRRVCFNMVNFFRRELHLIGVDSFYLNTTACSAILSQLQPCFEAGILRPLSIARCYPIEQALEAYHEVQQGGLDGKVVLTMHQSTRVTQSL